MFTGLYLSVDFLRLFALDFPMALAVPFDFPTDFVALDFPMVLKVVVNYLPNLVLCVNIR